MYYLYIILISICHCIMHVSFTVFFATYPYFLVALHTHTIPAKPKL